MIKKILLIFIFCYTILSSNAANSEDIYYKNIKEGSKLTFSDGTWSNKINNKFDTYFVKKISDGTGSYSEFYTPDGNLAFTTGTQYEFLTNGKLIGYSNADLKFYELGLEENDLSQRELSEEEIQELFKDFKIIKIAEFSKSTNSLKIKKEHKNFKIILLNDTDGYFYHYSFTSGNAKFKKYVLNGFLNITKKGMIQFSHFGNNTEINPWYILLIR